ncbi:hypothetical protein IPF89_00195 [Candidatus Saccharibacteria bacterium]|nr:MAG: hypothetical protein IPF89_00195 [Candidatus Saccharibacteria bacterium]
MTGQFERYRQPDESPSPEVFAAYVADKRELLQAIGKPIKRAPGNTMTEFFCHLVSMNGLNLIQMGE